MTIKKVIEICIVEWSILFRSKGSQTRRAQGYKKSERDYPSSLILDKHSPCQRGSLTRHKKRKRRVTIEYGKADRHANGSQFRAIDLRRWSNRNIVRQSLIVRQSPIVRHGTVSSKNSTTVSNSTTCRTIRILISDYQRKWITVASVMVVVVVLAHNRLDDKEGDRDLQS